MRFNDEYKKDMDNKKLSDDFIKKLSKKMDAEAGDGMEDPQKYLDDTGYIIEANAQVKVHDEKSRRSILFRTIATAAAAVIIFSASVLAINKNKPDIDPGDNSYDISETDKTVTGRSAPTTGTKKHTGKKPAVTTVTSQTTPPQTTAKKTESQTSAQQNNEPAKNDNKSGFASKNNLMNYVNERTAENSPLVIGYEAADYSRIFSQFYDVSFTDDGYSCTVKDPYARSRMPGWCAVYNEDTTNVIQATSDKIDGTDLDNFSRLIDFINSSAGSDSYYIYDVYKYDLSQDMDFADWTQKRDTNGKYDYCIEIVLKDYYEKYKKYNYNKEDFVVTYIIQNERCINTTNGSEPTESTINSMLCYELPYFVKSMDASENFLSEFNSQYSDYAVTIGNVRFNCVQNTFFRPTVSWVKNTQAGDSHFGDHIFPYVLTMANEEGQPFVPDPDLSVCIYFKPGTDEDTVKSRLEEMKPLFDKYDIEFITTDVLCDSSDFDRIKNSGGYIPDMTINSSSSSEEQGYQISRYHDKLYDFDTWSY